MRRLCVLCVYVGLTFSVAGLGSPVPETMHQSDAILSEEFVAALLSGYGDAPEIMPGRVAQQLEEIAWFPARSRVLGSIVVNDTTSTAFAVAPGVPAQVDQFFTERFGAAGWRSPERGEQRGFVRSTSTESR